jgi:2-C-methyl-D-erythritol 4-phosphate cytidylyltransferase
VVAAARTGHGAIAALPVVDTLKRVDDAGRIVTTVNRDHLWRAQTPQGFPRDVLNRAYREAHAVGVTDTDDAALVERIGVPVVVVRGSERALKVTEPQDFRRAELLVPLTEQHDT